jgi:hypothetical protein
VPMGRPTRIWWRAVEVRPWLSGSG